MDTSVQSVKESSAHAPSLSLTDIKRRGKSLTEREVTVIAYAEDSDEEICKHVKVKPEALNNLLHSICHKLGIIEGLPSADTRRALALMSEIIDTNGYRPTDEDSQFLLYAMGQVEAYASNDAADQSASPESTESADSIDHAAATTVVVEPAAKAASPFTDMPVIPTVTDVVASIGRLTPWKLRLLGYISHDLSRAQMLSEIAKVDPGYDSSSLDSQLAQVYKSLSLRGGHEDDTLRALAVQAYHMHFDQFSSSPSTPDADVVSVDETPPAPELVSEPAATVTIEPESSSTPTPEVKGAEEPTGDVASIVGRIAQLVAEGKMSKRRVQILDLLLIHEDRSKIADILGTSTSNVSVTLRDVRDLFGVQGHGDTVRVRGNNETALTIAAWKMYREQPRTQKAAPAESAPPPTEVVAEVPTEPMLIPEPALPTPEPVLEPEAELPSAESAEPAAHAPPEEDLPEPESQPEPQPIHEQMPASIHGEEPSPKQALLVNPHHVQLVRVLWTNSPTFEQDQASALLDGYMFERVDHFASFYPTIQGVSAVLLVKRDVVRTH